MSQLEIISIISLVLGILGMGAIIFRKLPAVASFSPLPVQGGGLISNIKKRSGRFLPIKNFSYELFLEKFLRRLRIFILRLEGFIFFYLQRLKEKQKKKNAKKDNYWKEIKDKVKR